LSIVLIENICFYLFSIFGSIFSKTSMPACPPYLPEPGAGNRAGRRESLSIVHASARPTARAGDAQNMAAKHDD
jgi:hypothetical protein